MACITCDGGKVVICGVPTRKDYFFDPRVDAVWSQASLWYEPLEVMRRKRGEWRARFVARVIGRLKFRPLTWQARRRYERTILDQEIK